MKRALSSYLLLLLGSIVCCGQNQMAAARFEDSESLKDTLSSSSIIEYAVRSVTPVHSLKGRELERLSSHSVADALRYFSGVQIKDYGGIGGLKTVNVRSLGAQHVGVFYDGIKITNAQNGQVDLGKYSLDNMEEVALYNAQKSETLQSASDYASASSVYFRTKRPVFDEKPYNIKAKMKYGSFSTVNPSLRYEQKIGKAALAAEAMYLHTDGDYLFTIKSEVEDTTARRANGDVKAARAEMTLFSPLFGGELQAHAYHYSSERGLPGPVIRRLSDQYASTDRQWDNNSFIQASYRKDWSRFAVLANAKGSYDVLEYLSDPASNSAAIYTHNKYYQKDVFGSIATAWYPVEWFSMNLAFDERWSDLNCNVPYFNYIQRFDTRTALAMTLTKGGFTAQSSLLHTYIQDITRGAAGPLSKLTPTIVLGWRNSRITTRAFYKSVFRAPTLNDLYYTLVGNVNLAPEYTRQFDVGADLQMFNSGKATSKLTLDIFYNRIKDKIVAMPVRSQFRWTMMNFGKVEGLGLNAGWSTSANIGEAKISALLNYSYEEARDLTEPDAHWYKGQIPYTPWHSASLILNAERGPWSACTSFLYTGVRYSASDNDISSRLDPWKTIDLSIGRDLSIRDLKANIALDVNNILNQQYEVVTRYPMPGTNINLKFTIIL